VPAKAREEALAAYRQFATGEVALGLPEQERGHEESADDDVSSGAGASTPAAAFRLYPFLDAEHFAGLASERETCVELLDHAILEGHQTPVGSVLTTWLRTRGIVEFRQEQAPGGQSDEWAELALSLPSDLPGRESLEIIPASVFTKRFFYGELHESFAVASSPRLHPENDKLLFLREECLEFLEPPMRFQYFVDASGLAEIVIDRETIGRDECLFAAAVFTRYNGIPEATLDGVRVPRSVTL